MDEGCPSGSFYCREWMRAGEKNAAHAGHEKDEVTREGVEITSVLQLSVDF
jgi:hypothetical protein